MVSQVPSLRQGGDAVQNTNTNVEEMWNVQRDMHGHCEVATDQRPNTCKEDDGSDDDDDDDSQQTTQQDD